MLERQAGDDSRMVEFGTDTQRYLWPRDALEAGARVLMINEGIYMGAEEYALSVRELLGALKASGVDTIRL